MRTMVDLEKIIWRTSKTFVFGNGYNIVLAIRPADIGRPADDTTRS
jgi:soluble P-type ATPase